MTDIPELVKHLEGGNLSERFGAARELARLGSAASPAAAALAKALDANRCDFPVRIEALRALGGMGVSAAPHEASLLSAMNNRTAGRTDVYKAAAEAYCSLCEALYAQTGTCNLAPLTNALRNHWLLDVRVHCAQTLGRLGTLAHPHAILLIRIIFLLRPADEKLRQAAADALIRMDHSVAFERCDWGKFQLDALMIHAAQSPQSSTAIRVVAVSVLVQCMLRDPYLTTDFRMMDNFKSLRQGFTTLVTLASTTLYGNNTEAREAAVQGLGRLADAVVSDHPRCDVAVRGLQTLTDVLKSNPLVDLRREAARALSHFGEAAVSALEDACMNDGDEIVREAASLALSCRVVTCQGVEGDDGGIKVVCTSLGGDELAVIECMPQETITGLRALLTQCLSHHGSPSRLKLIDTSGSVLSYDGSSVRTLTHMEFPVQNKMQSSCA